MLILPQTVNPKQRSCGSYQRLIVDYLARSIKPENTTIWSAYPFSTICLLYSLCSRQCGQVRRSRASADEGDEACREQENRGPVGQEMSVNCMEQVCSLDFLCTWLSSKVTIATGLVLTGPVFITWCHVESLTIARYYCTFLEQGVSCFHWYSTIVQYRIRLKKT